MFKWQVIVSSGWRDNPIGRDGTRQGRRGGGVSEKKKKKNKKEREKKKEREGEEGVCHVRSQKEQTKKDVSFQLSKKKRALNHECKR